ncbi:hypothetical protein PQO03_16750 [Lentisphaera profundi]|uniref:Lipoprotein n=1 Tax=Lentisphaera profundi TaxID=1658616 RepID=A0ABY7VW28_9BACT|nr:hypothetical protein [Lentisphaera profundi]WDE97478.1 hypothetical protein PQO03_16750 [Lentisphaera profundi]
MKLIDLSLISTFIVFIVISSCGGHHSSHTKYQQEKEKRAEKTARSIERQKLDKELNPPHKAPSEEYLQTYEDSKVINHNRKMDDLKRQMKAEEQNKP